jgi:hypothetical protein
MTQALCAHMNNKTIKKAFMNLDTFDDSGTDSNVQASINWDGCMDISDFSGNHFWFVTSLCTCWLIQEENDLG